MRPIIELLDGSDLSFKGGIADYTSLRWENKTDGCGAFEIHLPRAMPELYDGMIVHISKELPESYGVITSITLNKKGTVIHGSMLSRLLDWRYIGRDGFDASFTSGYGVGYIICLCARGGLVSDSNDFFDAPALFEYVDDGESVSMEADMNTSCLELMTSVARETEHCFGCTVENGQFKVFAYPYRDTGMVLNTEDGVVCDLSYNISSDSERNVFGYSLGDDENGYVYRMSVGSHNFMGVDRKVLNLGRFSSPPNSIIREKKALLTKSCSVEAKLTLDYPKMISLGDIVTIKCPEWGIEKKLNVSAVTEVWEDTYSCHITFGNPRETAYRKLLRIYR